jgi:hypothetical protein
MNILKRRRYDWHEMQRNALASTPGGPSLKGEQLIAYHEQQMLKLTQPTQPPATEGDDE